MSTRRRSVRPSHDHWSDWDAGNALYNTASLRSELSSISTTQVLTRVLIRGDADFGSDPLTYGDWIADVERPAERFRGRYQLRLNAHALLCAAGCHCGARAPVQAGEVHGHPSGRNQGARSRPSYRFPRDQRAHSAAFGPVVP